MSIAKYGASAVVVITFAGLSAACASGTEPETSSKQFPDTVATSRYLEGSIHTELRDVRQQVVAELHWDVASRKAGISLPGQGISRGVLFDTNVAPNADAANEMAHAIWEQESAPPETKPMIEWAYCCRYCGSGGSSWSDYCCDWMPWWCFDCPCG